MRCKVGDLCLITRGLNSGKYCTTTFFDPENLHCFSGVRGSWWVEANQPFVGMLGPTSAGYIPDEWLRPIRDSDGEDEVLRIAGRPQETPREMLESIRRELA